MTIYQYITQKIVDELKTGSIPWIRIASQEGGVPYNYVSGRPYSGINKLLLRRGGAYLTYKQIQEKGGKLISSGLSEAELEEWAQSRWAGLTEAKRTERLNWWNSLSLDDKDQFHQKSELSESITFFTFVEKKQLTKQEREEIDETEAVQEPGKSVKYPLIRMYEVYNVADVTGLDVHKVVNPDIRPYELAEATIDKFISEMGVTVDMSRCSPSYNADTDVITMREMMTYHDVEEYYGDFFHELVHSTGAQTRLNRGLAGVYGANDTDYGEEIIAEMGSAMVCASLQLDTEKAFKKTVAQIGAWIDAMSNDSRLCFRAASRSEKAAKLILGDC